MVACVGGCDSKQPGNPIAWVCAIAWTAASIMGALDAPDQFRPSYELWTVRREGWLPEFPGVKGHARDRESSDRQED